MPPLPTKSQNVIDDSACGQMFRELREKRGVSLRSVAVAMDVSASYLSDLELGRRAWSQAVGRKVSDAIKLAVAAKRKEQTV